MTELFQPTLDELSGTVLTFGKFRGRTFDDVPLPYLDWLNGQEWLRDPLKSKVSAYLNHPLIDRELDKNLGA